MGLLDNRELPEALVGALEAVVGRIPPATLSAAAAGIPEFAIGGFRVAGAKPDTLARRAVQLLRAKGPVPDRLRRLAAAHSLHATVVGLLSEEVLARRHGELASIFGPPELLLAMVFDPREPVRALAAAKLDPPAAASGKDGAACAPATPAPADPAAQRESVERVFGGLLGALEPVLERLAAADPAAPDPGHDLPGTVRDRLARLEADLREARGRASRVAGLEAKLAKVEAAHESLRAEAAQGQVLAAEREAALTAARQRGTEWRDEAVRLERTLAERVAAEVEARLADEAFGWLRDARALDLAAGAAAETDDLEARARRLLDRQREADRRYGTLAGLRARHDRLTALRDEIRQARAEALNPLSELAAMERELESAAAKLQRTPGVVGEPDRTPLGQALQARLADGEDAAVAEIDALLPELERLGLLRVGDMRAMAETRKRRLALRLASGQGPVPSSKARGTHEPLFTRLWRTCSGGVGPALLLLDGHNVLLRSEERYAGLLGPGGEPGEAARNALAEDADRVARAVPGSEARVFFDAPEASERAATPRVLVVFSGGRGSDRADGRIVDYLRFRKGTKGGPACVLVTDDGGLATRATAALRSVARVSVRQWEDLAAASKPVR